MIFFVGNRLVGGPENSVLTGVWYFYDTAFSNQFRSGYAAAIAICLFVTIAILSFVVNRILNGREDAS